MHGVPPGDSLGALWHAYAPAAKGVVMRKGRRWAIIGVLALSLLAMLSAVKMLSAQVGTSAVLGYVYDASGAAVPNAKVALVSPAIGFERSTQSDNAGYFKFPNLLPGTYDLTVSQQGFKTYKAAGLVLQVDQQLEHNPALQIGTMAQEVTVSAAGVELLEVNTATTGQVITDATVTALPLNGRNFLQLASLGTGATPTVLQGSSSSFATDLTGRDASTVHLGGNREAATSYLIDGIEARNDRAGNLTFQISVDEIQEFKTQRNFFPAEYGFHPGIVNVATKAGANEFHGAAWEFLRNQNLDARNFFGSKVEPFHQNQFGATGGGRILKNKLFFFGDYEGFRKSLSAAASAIYPDTTQFSGDLSDLSVFGNAPLYDPATFDPASGTRQQFSGNMIPQGKINPLSVKTIQLLFPKVATPPTGAPNLFGFPQTTQTDNQFTVRLDGQDANTFGKRTQMFGRFSYVNSLVLSAGLAPFQGLQRFQNARNFVYQANTSLSPSTVNLFRIGYQRDFSPFAYQSPLGSQSAAAALGLANTTTDPRDFFGPNFSMAGFSGTGGGFNLQTITNRYIIADNLTHIIGEHTLKGGLEFRFTRLMEETSTFANGSLTYTGQLTAQTEKDPATGAITTVPGTGSPIADFLLGLPSSGLAAFGSTLNHFHYREYAFFFQDDWKARPDLTFQLGLRYEHPTPPASEEKRVYLFDPKTGTLKFPALHETPSGVYTNGKKQFAPRVGVAWVPGFDKNSVLRAGFGISFDQTQFNELQFESFGTPFFNLQNIVQPVSNPVPQWVIGQNVFPDVAVPLIAPGFVPPNGSGPFSTEAVMKTPTVYQWTLDVERSLAKNWVLEIGYAGSTGKHLSRRYDADQCSVPTSLICDPAARPFPNLSELFLTTNGAKSNMHSLNVRGERRFANGLSWLVAYRWTKSLDTDSGASWASPTQRTACLNCDYGPSDFDIRHRFVSSTVWDIPLGRGKRFLSSLNRLADLAAGGWSLSAITTFQTGPWGNIFGSNATGDSGLNAHRGDCDLIGHNSIYAPGDLRSNGILWLNPANFGNPATGFFGNCGRGVFGGPGLNNWDIGVLKDFRVSERLRVEFRSEFFNAFNHAQFDLPSTGAVGTGSQVNNPGFGRITSAERPRVIQFGLKIYY